MSAWEQETFHASKKCGKKAGPSANGLSGQVPWLVLLKCVNVPKFVQDQKQKIFAHVAPAVKFAVYARGNIVFGFKRVSKF